MDHLPFIAASYGLAVGLILWLSAGAWVRTGRARRKLAAIDPRASR